MCLFLWHEYGHGGGAWATHHLRAVRGRHDVWRFGARGKAVSPGLRQSREAAGRAKCSYFIYTADTPKEDGQGRQFLLDYFQHCVLQAFPDDPKRMPPTMHYFMKINEIFYAG